MISLHNFIGNENELKIKVPFLPFLMDNNSMKYKQERVKDFDKLITEKDQGKVVMTTSVW